MLLKATEGKDALQEPCIPDSPCGKSHPFIAVHPCGQREALRLRTDLLAKHSMAWAGSRKAESCYHALCRPGDWRPLVIFFSLKMLKLTFLSALAALSFLPVAVGAASSRQCSQASFYGDGDGFAWQAMANGEPMDPGAMITAHRYLPFGTRLRVVNQDNGRSVVVRVADRGPYAGDRSLDLSYGAFARIASPSSGVARVCFTEV